MFRFVNGRWNEGVVLTAANPGRGKGSAEPRREPVTAKAVTVGDRWLISEYAIDRPPSC
jgi:hypothetical protein